MQCVAKGMRCGKMVEVLLWGDVGWSAEHRSLSDAVSISEAQLLAIKDVGP
ncbi:hypothetical protein TIFTF001_017659 [Ficus carica]|uniref:Uncharacterized protein n=1 Tax=Ficus carica TaxID=3494 RepID=A0AA88A9M7_FICCA|nr:hypothetical protein TIFTF001_017659 [Ficus carica]